MGIIVKNADHSAGLPAQESPGQSLSSLDTRVEQLGNERIVKVKFKESSGRTAADRFADLVKEQRLDEAWALTGGMGPQRKQAREEVRVLFQRLILDRQAKVLDRQAKVISHIWGKEFIAAQQVLSLMPRGSEREACEQLICTKMHNSMAIPVEEAPKKIVEAMSPQNQEQEKCYDDELIKISAHIENKQLNQAYELISQMPPVIQRARALFKLAQGCDEVLATINHHVENREFDQARELISQMPPVIQRARALLKLAKAHIDIQQLMPITWARSLLNEAEVLFTKLKRNPQILSKSSEALFKEECCVLRQKLTQSFIDAKDLHKAEGSARSVQDPVMRSKFLLEIARLYKKQGCSREARWLVFNIPGLSWFAKRWKLFWL